MPTKTRWAVPALYQLASGLFSAQCEDNDMLQGNGQDLDLRQDTNASIIQGFTMAYIYASIF